MKNIRTHVARRGLTAALAALALTFSVFAGELFVSTTGSDANDGSSWNDAFATLDHAVSVAVDDDVVHVAVGEYTLQGNGLVLSAALTLIGAGGTPAAVVVSPAAPTNPTLLILSNDAARVENMTFTGVALDSNVQPTAATAVAPVIVHLGTLENCDVTGNSMNQVGGVRQYGGIVSNCRLYDNRCYNVVSHWYGWGGGLSISGGVATNCVIYGNDVRCGGGGVYMTGGRVVSCVITNNHIERHAGSGVLVNGGTLYNSLVAGNTHSDTPIGGVAILRGTVERCVIRGHTGKGVGGGAAMVSSILGVSTTPGASDPLLCNSLVYNNTSSANGAGVYLAYGTIESSTIAGNISTTETGSGVLQTGGSIVNTIIHGNGTKTDDTQADNLHSTGGTVTHSLVTPAANGEGNVAANPLFTDGSAQDYTLRPGSPAIDAGSALGEVTNDVAGVSRPQGDGHDIGAHERIPGAGPLACGFTVSAEKLSAPGPVTLTGYADGADLDGLVYSWDFNNNGTVDATGQTAVWNLADVGVYDVLLTVTNTAGERADHLRERVITLTAPIAYVSPDGSAIAPYATWATAATNLQDAIDVVEASVEIPGTVYVAAGTYEIPLLWITVTRPVIVRSVNGPETTILKASNGGVDTPRRVMLVNHEAAVVSGFTMTNGKLNTNTSDDAGPAGVRLISGTVSNCVVRDNSGSDNSGGVDIRGGLLTHSTIINNHAQRSNNASVGSAGGIRMSGGVVRHCMISNNWARAYGGGVYQSAGTIQDSQIIGNYFNPPASATGQGAGVYQVGGILERCTVGANRLANRGGGLYVANAAAIVRNCLVVDNESAYDGAGAYLTAGNLRNVTLAANRVRLSGVDGLYQSGGAVSGAIVFGNGSPSYQRLARNVFKIGGTFDYSCTYPAVAGTGNAASNPLFVDAGAGDYRLAPGSPAIDAAATLADVTVDLNGVARPLDGDGDGEAAPDMGAFESVAMGAGNLTCGFTADPEEGLNAVTSTFTAYAGGANTNIVWYGWDFDNNGMIDESGADKRETTRLFGLGYYDVALTVSNAIGESAIYVRQNCVRVGPATNYVSLSGSHRAPYETWAKAATNLQDAVDAVWTWAEAEPATVWVTNGVIPVRAIWTVIDRPMTVRSVNGPTATTLLAANPVTTQRRVLLVNHADASVSGFTMTGGTLLNDTFDNAGPGGLRLIAGSVSNCVITGNIGSDNSGGVEVRGGLLTDSVIANNRAYRSNNSGVGLGGGIWVSGGLVRGCVITNNQANGVAGACGGGVRLTGGKIENCRIERNVGGFAGRSDRQGGGIYQSGGEVLACILVSNTVHGLGGGLYTAGGALRSSLVVGNQATTGSGHGLYVNASAARIENVTVADNSLGSAGSGLYLANGKVTNSIAWFNGTSDLFQSGGSIGYSCWSGAPAVNGNLGGDPKFRARAQGNYRLSGASPCVNTGVNYLWTGADRDLDGNPRILFKICDMGAYENVSGRATMLFLR